MDKSFERKYSINVARLKIGQHEDSFEVDNPFFEHFESSVAVKDYLKVDLSMVKYNTHLDVTFSIKGEVMVPCDRCSELYPQFINESNRIIYAFDEEMNFTGYEVMYVDSRESHLSIVQELYDFINLAIPLRRVPSEDVHICDEKVLKVLGLATDEESLKIEDETENMDPRWEKLKKLKDQFD